MPSWLSRLLILGGMGAALVAGAVFAVGHGAMPIPRREVLSIVYSNLIGQGGGEAAGLHETVIMTIRLPRVLLSMTVGAALATAGASLQGIFRNPLADPGLIGVSSGAALGAVIMIATGLGSLPAIAGMGGTVAIALGAFIGGMLATMLVYTLATRRGATSVTTMLLAGIAINALAGALIGYFTYASDDAQLRNITLWTLGSLGGANWTTLRVAVPVVAVGVFVLIRLARSLDVLLLGESEARHLGVDVDRLQRWVVSMSALIVGVVVGLTGLIGFIGLVVPHLIRLSLGPGHRTLLPAAAIGGAFLMVCSDLVSRTVVAPTELPIGIVTAMLGAPFFLWLVVVSGRVGGP